MKVFVNETEVEIFSGAKAENAIRKFHAMQNKRMPRRKLTIKDAWDNIIDITSPLKEGSKIYFALVFAFAMLTIPLHANAGTTEMDDEEKTVTILSVNDMHAAVNVFPKFATIVDSLRKLYPSMLLVSAGDNRTGDPINDLYEVTSYPMTALMNQVGFDVSAIGNHEFDSKLDGFRTLINLSNFRYIAANVLPPDSMRLHVAPYKFFERDGIRIGFLGVIQINNMGTPDTHPDNVKDIRFLHPGTAIPEYKWMRNQCDVLILLSHCGFDDEMKLAEQFTYFDGLIGGHSHTRVDGYKLSGGVMVTQAENKLKYATLSQYKVKGGKVVGKEAKLIPIASSHAARDPETQAMVDRFSDNPEFQKVLTQVTDDFTCYEELGCMMCDALRAETNADITLQNSGGVRYDIFEKGPMKVMDILRLDPFGNEAVECHLTGAELRQMLIDCYLNDELRPAYVSGISYEITLDKKNPEKVKDVVIKTEKGKKFDMKRKYKVVLNSYAAAVSTANVGDPGKSLQLKCSDLTMEHLQKQPSVNYKGMSRVKIIQK